MPSPSIKRVQERTAGFADFSFYTTKQMQFQSIDLAYGRTQFLSGKVQQPLERKQEKRR